MQFSPKNIHGSSTCVLLCKEIAKIFLKLRERDLKCQDFARGKKFRLKISVSKWLVVNGLESSGTQYSPSSGPGVARTCMRRYLDPPTWPRLPDHSLRISPQLWVPLIYFFFLLSSCQDLNLKGTKYTEGVYYRCILQYHWVVEIHGLWPQTGHHLYHATVSPGGPHRLSPPQRSSLGALCHHELLGREVPRISEPLNLTGSSTTY